MIIPMQGMGGISPKITPELLPPNAAQVAKNVRLHNGGVASLKTPTVVATPTRVGSHQTIYRFGKNQPDYQYWFSWSSHVNVARGPIAGDTEERTYYTGDGVPKKTNFPLATQSGTGYPVAYYNLKVPAPTAAPTLSSVAGAGPVVTESRAYVYTNVSAWGEESAPSPATIGDATAATVVQLSNFSAVPTGSYSITQRYIYRSVSASSGTNYYHVGTIAAATTTFTDNVDIAAIGEHAVLNHHET